MRRGLLLTTLIAAALLAQPALALDDAHKAKAEAVLARGFDYLRKQQGPDGSWTPKPGPAVTALVAAAMLEQPGLAASDPVIAGAIDYVLARQKPDGGIYESLLSNYNTAIALMALGRVKSDDPRLKQAITKAQDYLRSIQWAEPLRDPSDKPITASHPWYGGAGYGSHGRPDLSNTAMMIAGLNDSGLNCNDPAYVRAMEFITKLQGTKSNAALGDRITPDGGFIYAASTSRDAIDAPQSQAGETVDASGRSRLRTYGSMTYAGFMSYLYAQLDREDPRVKDAYAWIRENYTLDENPHAGQQGYYYYLHMLSRALKAWGDPVVVDGKGVSHDWRAELIDKLASLQRPDGSFLNEKDRWMEGDANLVTAYALLALQHALR